MSEICGLRFYRGTLDRLYENKEVPVFKFDKYVFV
jgi:hypothetical protein